MKCVFARRFGVGTSFAVKLADVRRENAVRATKHMIELVSF